jgi:hypothetical protein
MIETDPIQTNLSSLLNTPGLVSCWDFSFPSPYVSKEGNAYSLQQGNERLSMAYEGIVGNNSVAIDEGGYLFIPREQCGGLNIYGKQAQVSVLAWVKRKQKSHVQCEAVAGMWNETEKKRQYCLFLNLRLFDSADQVCGHVSALGGATPGQQWCTDASIGSDTVAYGEWSFIAFTYDGEFIRSYLNGEMDERKDRNPYFYDQGIFDGGKNGSGFTVGAVDRLGEMGNYFTGLISGLAVFNRALSAEEIRHLQLRFPLNQKTA